MSNITTIDTTNTISTIELRTIINGFRKEHGESSVRNDDFVARVEDELGGTLPVGCETFAHPTTGVSMMGYTLTLEQATLAGLRESKRLT